MNEALENLLRNPRVWRGKSQANTPGLQGLASGYPSGYPILDGHLPGGGWPRHALTEILLEHHGRGELKLVMPALARLSQSAGWIAWIAPPFQPYPPALLQWGIDLSRLLVVHSRKGSGKGSGKGSEKGSETLWAAEEALSSGNCAAVLLWPDEADNQSSPLGSKESRRLQLAAEKGRSWAIAFRSVNARSRSSAAALRLELAKGEQGMDVVILKSRGGRPARLRNVLHNVINTC